MFVRMAHTGFMNDCLDAFIVGMCMHHLGMKTLDVNSHFKTDSDYGRFIWWQDAIHCNNFFRNTKEVNKSKKWH